MGYTTDFTGAIQITPPLNNAEMEYLHKFASVRHMWRTRGPYFVNGGGDGGQDIEPDVIDHNSPDPSQPGLWCQWIPTEDGTALQWDQEEKFYKSLEWMRYLIDHFLKPDSIAKQQFPEEFHFLTGHMLNGTIEAVCEDFDEHWLLNVANNIVTRIDLGLET